MEEDESVFVFGMGVDDPKSILGTTAGLVERFGASRCFDTPLAEEGITVPGSKTRQDFRYGSIGELGPSHTLILRLTGVNPSGSQVSAPLTVTTKLTCPTCGSKSSSTAKFCASCGTGLES